MSSIQTAMFILAARRLVLPLLFVLVVFLTLNAAKKITPQSKRLAHNTVQIEGRWQAIRAANNLPPLPELVTFPVTAAHYPSAFTKRRASRFNLRLKRSAEEAEEKSRPPELHITRGAEGEDGVPLHHMAAAFRAIALAEKQTSSDQTKARQERLKYTAGIRKGQRKAATGRPGGG